MMTLSIQVDLHIHKYHVWLISKYSLRSQFHRFFTCLIVAAKRKFFSSPVPFFTDCRLKFSFNLDLHNNIIMFTCLIQINPRCWRFYANYLFMVMQIARQWALAQRVKLSALSATISSFMTNYINTHLFRLTENSGV